MSESQDLSEPILDPILLLTEGTDSLPSSSKDIAPLDSLDEFDKLCTVDVRAKLHQRDRLRLEQEALVEKREHERAEPTVAVPEKKLDNVLSRINDQWSRGPTSILHRALTNKLRVKVWVRNHTAVRSVLTGFVAAFDKHLNLALVDVDEAVYLVKDNIKSAILTPELGNFRLAHDERSRLLTLNEDSADDEKNCTDFSANERRGQSGGLSEKTSAGIGERTARAGNCPESEKTMPSVAQTTLVGEKIGERSKSTTAIGKKKKRNRAELGKATMTQRFIPQLFIRGEQIVMVALADI